MTKPKYPQSDALELARLNAIRLLGLHENNTPEDRARAMGFVDNMYHGSKQDLQGGFKPGYDDNLSFVTPNPSFANQWIGKGRHTERIGDAAKAELQAVNDKYRAMKYKNMDYDSLNNLQGDEFTKEYDRRNALHKLEMQKEFGGMPSPDRIHSTVYPMRVKAKKTFDPENDMHHMHDFFAKNQIPQKLIDLYKTGNYMMYETKPVVAHLKSKGFDSMKLRESSDGDYTTVAMFDPAHIRSRFAAFDPARAHEAGLSYAEGGSTTDIDAMKLALMNKAKFMKGSKAPERLYHGTGNLESLHSFDPAMTGKGLDQLGSGFYFASDPQEASGYAMHAHNAPSRQGEGKIGGSSSPGVVAAHVNIQKPIRIGKNGMSLNDANVNLTHDQIKRIMGHAPNINHPDESPLGNHVDTSRGVTPQMIHDIAKLYTGNNLHALENDIFPDESTAYRNALHQVTGYDGVIKDFGNGRKHYVAWFPNQIKSAIGNKGGYDPANPDITMAKGGTVKDYITITERPL